MLFYGFVPISRLAVTNPNFQKKHWELINNVGTLETPFVLLNFDTKPPSKLLDLGCATSYLSLYLSTMGYDVTGIDFRDVGYSNPNLHFINKNLFDVDLENELFDCVLCVSFLEHVGLGHYGEQKIPDADKKTMKVIKKVLKRNGPLFIIVPGGRSKIYQKYSIEYIRIFDPEQVEKLCDGFKIDIELFFKKENQEWVPTTRDELSKIEYVDEDVGAILIKAHKK